MESRSSNNKQTKKRKRLTDREFNTAVHFLRCKQLGFTLRELFDVEYGEITDLMTESANDQEKYDYLATQEDINNFGKMF